MEILFISDLHLSADRPEKLELFQRFMRSRARGAAALYILGDIFDQFWVGNDDNTPPNEEVIAELLSFSKENDQLFIIRGNRDLMLREEFKTLSGATLLPDQHVISLHGEQTLISHGDVYCTLDKGYQRYRGFMESAFTRRVFPALPRCVRLMLSHGLKPLIKKSSVKKDPTIIDVDQSTVEVAMRTHGVTRLIHGHTHRTDVHEFRLDGKNAKRTVLPDWYEEDGVLVCTDSEQKLMRIEDYLSA